MNEPKPTVSSDSNQPALNLGFCFAGSAGQRQRTRARSAGTEDGLKDLEAISLAYKNQINFK